MGRGSRALGLAALLALFATLLMPAAASAQPGNGSANGNGNGPLQRGAAISDRYIVLLRDGVNPGAFARARGLDPDVTFTSAANGFAAAIPGPALQGLVRNPNVVLIEPDSIMTVDAPPTGVDRIDADENATAAIDGNPATGSADIDIAVLDTGVDTDHPDLNVAGGAGYAGVSILGIFWVCDDGTASYEDGHGHGTHVSGTIAALDNGANVGGTEVVGPVSGARIWGVKVLDDTGSGAVSCIIDGIDWVTEQKLDYQNSGGATGTNFEVANMSLGGGNSAALCTALANSVAAGIVYPVAAGNGATDAANSSPANCASALTVSAIADFDGQPGGLDDQTVTFSICTEDTDDSFACFSNYGSVVDIAAPGVSILSTLPGGGYGTSSGTSMASPHVAGAVALYLEAGNALADPSGAAVAAALTSAGWTVSQTSACGFTGDPDSTAEPLVYVGSSCTGPPSPVTDIAITDVSAPASVEAGDPATVSVTVVNQGNQDVSGISVTLTTSRGVITDSPQIVSLNAATSTVLDFDWNTVGVAPGDATLTASHDVADDDASDDTASTTSTVTTAPAPVTDIAITDLSAPASVEIGETASVAVTIANEGNQNVSAISVTLATTEGAITDSPQIVSLDAGANTVVNFTWDTTGASAGTSTLTASHDVADDDASDNSAITSSTVTDPPPPPTGVHVGDLDASSASQGRNWTATVTIRVHDGDENPVAGATVSGSWSGASGGSTSCTTGGSGSCSVSVSGIPKKTKSVAWTVTNIAAGDPYEAGDNHDPDNDSNGTSITVAR